MFDSQIHGRRGPTHVHGDELHALLLELVRDVGRIRVDDPDGRAMPLSEVWALHELDTDHGLPQHELSERLCLDKSTVSRLVRGLEERGLVTRTRDDTNRRVVRATITDAGRRLHRAVGAQLDARQEAVLGLMTSSERDALRVGLTAFLRALGGSDPP